jgi:hypothetical protein
VPSLYLLSHRLEVPLHRSTPTEMQSISENDFECFASTGVKTPETISPNVGALKFNFLEETCGPSITSKLPAIRHQPGKY